MFTVQQAGHPWGGNQLKLYQLVSTAQLSCSLQAMGGTSRYTGPLTPGVGAQAAQVVDQAAGRLPATAARALLAHCTIARATPPSASMQQADMIAAAAAAAVHPYVPTCDAAAWHTQQAAPSSPAGDYHHAVQHAVLLVPLTPPPWALLPPRRRRLLLLLPPPRPCGSWRACALP